MLPADGGDCFLLRFKGFDKYYNIIVDGGLKRTYHKFLKKEILSILHQKENVDLLIITHTDRDHIGGVLAFFEDQSINKSLVKKIIFNSKIVFEKLLNREIKGIEEFFISSPKGKRKVTYEEGEKLDHFLRQCKLQQDIPYLSGKKIFIGGAELFFLSPRQKDLPKLIIEWEKEIHRKNKKHKSKVGASSSDYSHSVSFLLKEKEKRDYSIANISSIAFLLRLPNQTTILFAGDTNSRTLIDSLTELGITEEEKLTVNFWKLSHHASKRSTNSQLIKMIDCENFLISGNGHHYNLPNKTTLSRILGVAKDNKKNTHFYFNYSNKILHNIFSLIDKSEFNFECYYPNLPTEGMYIKL